MTTYTSILNKHLAHCKARIKKHFFRHPERFKLLSDFQPGFQHWLECLGLTTPQAGTLSQRLPDRFALALHEEWIKDSDRYVVISEAIDTPFTRAIDRRRKWLQYAACMKDIRSRLCLLISFDAEKGWLDNPSKRVRGIA